MYRSILILSAVFFASVCRLTSVEAHDASLHKGKPTVGKVESLSDTGVTLTTANGTTPVTFQEKTKFERGDTHASAQEIQPGDQLTVFGTKLPSGELVAREVLLPAPNAKGESPSHSTTHQHSGSRAR
jgi:hypothetical protein